MKKFWLPLLLLLCTATSCTVYRSIVYWTPGIDEYGAFPRAGIETGDNKFHFYTRPDSVSAKIGAGNVIIDKKDTITVDEYLSKSRTTAFLIIRNDTILFERYYRGYDRSKISTFFSVTKSVTSLLTGIAVDEGYIKSVHDPVTDYIPELKSRDPHFQRLTIEHLLNMEAGLKFNESYTDPFSGMAKLFYGRDQLKFIEKLKFIREPGEENDYNSATTAILGIVLERATGRPYAEYLEEKVWKPLGMEYGASVNLDDRTHRSAKAYGGLNATAIDLAKIGRLYLNGGNWNGTQIVSRQWVERSTTPCIEANHMGGKYDGYQYGWYSNSRVHYKDSTGVSFSNMVSASKFARESGERYYKLWKVDDEGNPAIRWQVTYYDPQYYALGIMSQTLYVDPERKYIVVRLGEDWAGRYNTVLLANTLMRSSPVVEEMW